MGGVCWKEGVSPCLKCLSEKERRVFCESIGGICGKFYGAEKGEAAIFAERKVRIEGLRD